MKEMRIHLTEPLKMDFDMELNKLMLLVGHNGTGKSLVLKLNWVLSFIVCTEIEGKTHAAALKLPVPPIKELTQYTFDKSFDNQNFDGTVGAEFENGTCSVVLEKGKVKDVMIFTEAEEAPIPVFMSTSTRTFEDIHRFLAMEKIVGQQKVLDHYKLYDVLLIQKLKKSCETGIPVTAKIEARLKTFDLHTKNFESFRYDPEQNIFLAKIKDSNEINLATLSKGEQAIISMLLVTNL